MTASPNGMIIPHTMVGDLKIQAHSWDVGQIPRLNQSFSLGKALGVCEDYSAEARKTRIKTRM